jgi:hypothetical protein
MCRAWKEASCDGCAPSLRFLVKMVLQCQSAEGLGRKLHRYAH